METSKITNKIIKIGWVGSGFNGQLGHLQHHQDIPGSEIVALAELRPNLGKRACVRYNIPKYYKDHKALLEDPDVEAVIAIVHRYHTAPVALDVLNAGRHLFTEKPMASTLEQAERLVAAGEKNNLCHAVGFMRRHDEGVQIAKKMLDELRYTDELGPIRFVRVFCFSGEDWCNVYGEVKTDEPRPTQVIWPIAPDWLPKKLHKDYDYFVNVYTHDVNLIRYLFDERPKVESVFYRNPAGSLATLDFSEFSGVFEWGDIKQNRWEEGVEIIFEKGKLTIDLPPAFLRNQAAKVKLYKDDGTTRQVISPQADWTWAFRRQEEAFINNLLNGTTPLASAKDGLQDFYFMEDIWKHLC
jgi:predicted dehydrogenase